MYAPIANRRVQEVEDFYDLLESTVEKHQSLKTIIIGDSNSKVSWQSQGRKRHKGHMAMGQGMKEAIDWHNLHKNKE